MTETLNAPEPPGVDITEAMVAESGSYELLQKRLSGYGEQLLKKTQALNESRLNVFGRSEQSLILRTSARTENNCIARDIVRIGERLLFGYNVFLGLRKETAVEDVFALYRIAGRDDAEELEVLPHTATFLDDPRFVSDFHELYAYYKHATLVQLQVRQDKLLAAFQVGQGQYDLRVFRWSLSLAHEEPHYIDNRGERDMALPPSHDFEWIPTTRENHVGGRYAHINILDTIFVEAIGGDLTVKIENNTETGQGIYSEPVEDKNQSLADADIAYAHLGLLILLRIRPYREKAFRYLVFNERTLQVERIDAIGVSCIQLPEDHGIIFPGGYYLQTGEYKRFDLPQSMLEGLRFKRVLRSPNGEDVLYVFYQPNEGHYALFSYNLINKTLAAPLVGNGYARFPDGRILISQIDSGEPERAHPMQLWQTPFAKEEVSNKKTKAGGFFGRIGNAGLVRGISDLIGIARVVREPIVGRTAYEDLIRQCNRSLDAYFWLDAEETGGLSAELKAIGETARATLAEFEKVDSVRRDTLQALHQAELEQHTLLTDIAATLWRKPDDFIQILTRLRERRGRLHILRELRYVDLSRVEAMDADLATEQQRAGERAMRFLSEAGALDGYRNELDEIAAKLPEATTTQVLGKLLNSLDKTASGLDLLIEQLGSLPGGDAVMRTEILERISSLYADVNRLRAGARRRSKSLGNVEMAAEFGAQFKLFGQAVENALEFSDTPEKCDDALTRLLAQLEDLEGRFAEYEDFLSDIADKRESVYEAVSGRRQSLLEARQRRVQSIMEAGLRILEGVPRRMAQFNDLTQVHTYFATDPLIAKLRKLAADLRALGADIMADDLDTQAKTVRDQALRSIRDKQDLVADDGSTLRFGKYAFTINRQGLDLALVPKEGKLVYHLMGTDYYAPVHDARLSAYGAYWDQALISESDDLYRAEYLAGTMLEAALTDTGELKWDDLRTLLTLGPEGEAKLAAFVRRFASARYREGYQKGVHDEDAVKILIALAGMQNEAGLLVWGPTERALALLYWHHGLFLAERESLLRKARAARQIQDYFARNDSLERLITGCSGILSEFAHKFAAQEGIKAVFGVTAERLPDLAAQAAAYLVRQIADPQGVDDWVVSGLGQDLAAALTRDWEREHALSDWQSGWEEASAVERWCLARDWAASYAAVRAPERLFWVDDAASILAIPGSRRRINSTLECRLTDLLGEHPRIEKGALTLNLNDFRRRFQHHKNRVVPAFEALHALRQELLSAEKGRMRLSQFQAKPLSSFVRNRLIDEVYLPLVGDNLAKQIGAAGADSRTDRMGMLLLISPPGYGKTTLMEYVADRLGLIFVRINCPALGHAVTDLDPANAEHGAARLELEKLNLGLAMGNNVMLYLDDIQHASPEFLQKFIALADGTRRIEGVWQGEARTYDMRGKRFAIVMAGNPYTESGDVFKIPDMLANRADIYNLGDVLSGREALFALSYIENSLTSNPVLLPLAVRDPKDIQLLVRLAEGEEIANSEFSHGYSTVELNEFSELLQRLFRIRDLLLKVNLAYIESAAQKDAYRSEPAFKLQGSYRNMNKLAAKATALMRDDEMDALLRDHYRGEAQTLTTGAEENLLKLAELLGTLTRAENERWQAIKEGFVRQRKLGGEGASSADRIAATLLDVARSVDDLKISAMAKQLDKGLLEIANSMEKISPPEIHVAAADITPLSKAIQSMNKAYEGALLPLLSATYHKIKMDHSIWDEVKRIAKFVDTIQQETESKETVQNTAATKKKR